MQKNYKDLWENWQVGWLFSFISCFINPQGVANGLTSEGNLDCRQAYVK